MPSMQAYDRNPALANLLIDPEFAQELVARQDAWRRVVTSAVQAGISVPGTSTRYCFSTSSCLVLQQDCPLVRFLSSAPCTPSS